MFCKTAAAEAWFNRSCLNLNFNAMKKLLSLCAILLFAISCSENQPVKKEESLMDSFLRSNAFKELGIGLAELELSNATIKDEDIETKSVIIPYKGSLKYISSKGHVSNGNHEFKSAFTFEYITNLNYEQLSESLKNKSYTGIFEVKSNQNDQFQFSVVNGKLDKIHSKVSINSRLMSCSGSVGSDAWVQGVASCAAGRIDDMNWWDYSWCIIRLPACWGQHVVSCMIDGCIL